MNRTSIVSVVVCLVLVAWSSTTLYAADPCNRACLEKHIDEVLAAMIARNPNQLMLARDAYYTENGVEMRLGDGLWGTLSARGKYSLYVCDTESGQAGLYGTVSENGRLDYIALRVKVVESLISDIELIVARPQDDMATFQPPSTPSAGERMNALTPRAQFLQTVPSKEQMSRDRLIAVANSYFMGLANNTGQFTAPFAPTCERWENGLHTTNQKPNPNLPKGVPDILCMSCEQQQKSGWFAFVTDIRNRRFPIVDTERGLVLSFAFFDHNAAVREYRMPDGSSSPNMLTYPITIQISELFQIREGKIDQIEAVISPAPYRMKSAVWDE